MSSPVNLAMRLSPRSLRASLAACSFLGFLLPALPGANGIGSQEDYNIERRIAAQAWVDEMTHRYQRATWQESSAEVEARNRANQLRALEEQRAWAAERERQVQAAREKLEAENRLWSDALNHPDVKNPQVHEQRLNVWRRTCQESAAQGRVLTLNADEYADYANLKRDWLKQSDTDPAAALNWGLTLLYGPYGTAREFDAAKRAFNQIKRNYLVGLTDYFWALQRKAPTSTRRLDGSSAWATMVNFPEKTERDPANRKRASLCLLAIELTDPNRAVQMSAHREAVVMLIQRALAAEHAALLAHPQPIRDPWTGGVWLDAGTARVLWDLFGDVPEFAPCAEIQADFRRLFREAQDPISHTPADFYGENLVEWDARGVLAENSSTATDLLVLETAAGLLRNPKFDRTWQFVAGLADPDRVHPPHDAGLADLCKSLVADQFRSDQFADDPANLTWLLIAPYLTDDPPLLGTAKSASEFADHLRLIAQLIKPPKTAPEILALAKGLIAWGAQSPEIRPLRHALAVLAMNNSEILDDGAVADAVCRAVRLYPGESKLLPELEQTGDLADRLWAAVGSDEMKRHPLFWGLLLGEQLERLDTACESLRGIEPSTPAIVDLIAALAAKRGDGSLEETYDAQLAALAVPAEQRRYSRPQRVLAEKYDQMVYGSERGKETEAVRLAREALAAAGKREARQVALQLLVALQREADGANRPNEKALAALAAAAAAPDPDGIARLAYLEALRSAQAWMPLANARRAAAGNSPEHAALAFRFGGPDRAGKAWNLLLASYARNESWARPEVDRLSLAEVRTQLRELIADDFSSADNGHRILQAYLATQTARDEADWHQRLASLQPSADAGVVVRALVQGITEAWTTPDATGDAARDAVATESEACLNCLVATSAGGALGPLVSERKTPDQVFYWGTREALEALAALGPKLPKPRAWSENEFGQFTPEVLGLYFADLIEGQLETKTPESSNRLIARVPLEKIIFGADSMMRGRGDWSDTPTLAGVHSYPFGDWLLTVAMDKIPNGHALAGQLAQGQISPAQLIAQLRERKVIH